MMTDKRGCQRRPIKAILLARLPTLLYNPAHHQTLFEKSISSIERVQMLDLAHQLKVISGDTAQNLDLSKQIVIQRTERIVVVDSRDEVHQDHLGISLSSITSFTTMTIGVRLPFVDSTSRQNRVNLVSSDQGFCDRLTVMTSIDFSLVFSFRPNSHSNIPHRFR
jgi:hypothetical protein